MATRGFSMARKPLSSRLGKGVCYALVIAFVLPLLFSATAPQAAASPGKNWVTPSTASASSGLVENFWGKLEDFETILNLTAPGDAGAGWTYDELDTPGNSISLEKSGDWKTEGAYAARIVFAAVTMTVDDWGQLTKTFDLTSYRGLELDYFNTNGDRIRIEFYIGGVLKKTSEATEDTTWVENISDLSGSHEIKIKVIVRTTTGNVNTYFDYLRVVRHPSIYTIDDNTATRWQPSPENESGAWINWDLGIIKVVSGCRIYWGADENYRPIAYHIQTSDDNSSWTTVATETEAAPASAWKEYSWTENYTRYTKLVVDTHGENGTEIYEMDAEFYLPTIENITVDDSLIDRDLDYSGSGAELDTTITIRVQDNSGHERISAVYISIRDNKDSLVVDNAKLTDNTVVDDTTLDFTYSFDCPDNLPDDNLGAFDVNVVVEDIWGASDNNNWGGDGASLFTVDDLSTTINFNPAQPVVGHDLVVSGTISRVVGTASADNAWLIDANHGTFVLGAENSWSETYTINAASSGENVAMTVRMKDLPLDGEFLSSYLVSDSIIYQIEVRWENDYSLAPEPIENQNWEIKFNWAGGTQSKTLENNPENIIVASGGIAPFLVELNDNDNYWRRRVPQVGGGVIVFVLPEEDATINQYIMSITDYTDQFDTPDGWVSIRAYIDNNFVVINDDWWDATNYAYAYLVLHEWYEVYLFGAGNVQRHIGHIQAESDLTLDPFVVSALEFGEDKIFRWEAIEFESSRGDNGEVVVRFRDTHDNTDNVILNIYTLTGEWRYQAEYAYPLEFEDSGFQGDNDNSYKIKLDIASREFGSWDEWMTVGPIIAPLPLPTPEAGGGLGATIPIAGLAGVFLVAIVAMSFSERHASTGALAIAFTAIFLKFISVKVGANLMPVPSSVLILLLFLAIMWKAGEKL